MELNNIIYKSLKVWKLKNKNIGFSGMWKVPGPLSEKLNFEFVINSKTDFSGG